VKSGLLKIGGQHLHSALGVDVEFVQAMIKAGLPCGGGEVSEKELHQFLMEHPEFKVTIRPPLVGKETIDLVSHGYPGVAGRSKAEIDALIALPEYLTAPDGRRFEIKGWFPEVAVHCFPEARLSVTISLPEAKEGRTA
jgi:hypothetical protein